MLKNKKLFLFDIDGTIAVGNTLYEGSAQLLSYIESIGGKAYYITNNSTKSNADYVDLCTNAFLFGIQIVNKPDVLRAYTSYSMETEKEQALFKDIADALIDPRENLTVVCAVPSEYPSSKAQELFETAWASGKQMSATRFSQCLRLQRSV